MNRIKCVLICCIKRCVLYCIMTRVQCIVIERRYCGSRVAFDSKGIFIVVVSRVNGLPPPKKYPQPKAKSWMWWCNGDCNPICSSQTFLFPGVSEWVNRARNLIHVGSILMMCVVGNWSFHITSMLSSFISCWKQDYKSTNCEKLNANHV